MDFVLFDCHSAMLSSTTLGCTPGNRSTMHSNGPGWVNMGTDSVLGGVYCCVSAFSSTVGRCMVGVYRWGLHLLHTRIYDTNSDYSFTRVQIITSIKHLHIYVIHMYIYSMNLSVLTTHVNTCIHTYIHT